MPDEIIKKSQRQEMPPEREEEIPRMERGTSLEREIERELHGAGEEIEKRSLEGQIAELKQQIKEIGPVPSAEEEQTEEQKRLSDDLVARLLVLARKKNRQIAIEEAEDTNEPYILDSLQGLLASPRYKDLK